jgi:CheY-like chemotaxis protein
MSTAKQKVLIVEDEKMLREAYAQILSLKGYDVATACDGVEGLEQLEKVKPGLVLLDILMPRMDGLEFLRQAKVKQNYPNTKVLAFSNLSNASQVSEMVKNGADQHILKSSVSPAQLVSLVEGLLKK